MRCVLAVATHLGGPSYTPRSAQRWPGGTGKDEVSRPKVTLLIKPAVRRAGWSGLQLRAKESQLARIADHLHGLNDIAAHGEHQHAGELTVDEAEQRGLAGDWQRDEGGSRSPVVQQVPGDVLGADRHWRVAGRARPEIDLSPGIGGQDV